MPWSGTLSCQTDVDGYVGLGPKDAMHQRRATQDFTAMFSLQANVEKKDKGIQSRSPRELSESKRASLRNRRVESETKQTNRLQHTIHHSLPRRDVLRLHRQNIASHYYLRIGTISVHRVNFGRYYYHPNQYGRRSTSALRELSIFKV